MKAGHDPLFVGEAIPAFCTALSRKGVSYSALAYDLEVAGLPRPSVGNARYRTLILSLVRVGDEPWELTDRIRASFRADLHLGYDMPPAPPAEAPPVSGAQVAWLKKLGTMPDHIAAATVARMTASQRAAASALAARLAAIPELRIAAARLAA